MQRTQKILGHLTGTQCGKAVTTNNVDNGKGKVVIVGTGIVGVAWAVIFSRGGYHVSLYDVKYELAQAAMDNFRKLCGVVVTAGLNWGQSVDTLASRVSPVVNLEEAIKGAVYLQECTPENLDLKKKVFNSIDQILQKQGNTSTIIASSSSNMAVSLFASQCVHKAQCLIAHPVNPPFAIPVVEIVPAPFTDQAVTSATRALMDEIGQAPVLLNKEVDGFLVNRLQYALLAEAFRLVEDGVASPEDIDTTITNGLALRWSFTGPFQTIDLNALNGVKDYCKRYLSSIYRVVKQQDNNREFSQKTIDTIDTAMRKEVPIEYMKKRLEWRNNRLLQLAIHKNVQTMADIKSCVGGRDVNYANLNVPPLPTLASMLQKAAATNFNEANVSIVDCPDLRQWGLSCQGMGGSRKLVDVGGVPFVNDPAYHDVKYELRDILQQVGSPDGTVFGPGAASRSIIGVNGEALVSFNGQSNQSDSYFSKVGAKGEVVADNYHSTVIGPLGNLFVSDGQHCKVLKVSVKGRTGDKNFIATLREGLAEQVGSNHVGLAGFFHIPNGKFKYHVMPKFKKTRMTDGPEVMDWLKFYEAEGKTMTAATTFLTGDPTADKNSNGMDLRLDHTHFFDKANNIAGHYHYDTTPAEVEYVAYLVPVDQVYRVSNAYKQTKA